MNMNLAKGSLLIVEVNLAMWLPLQTLLPLYLPDIEIIHAGTASAALNYLYCSGEGNQPQLILQDLYLPNRADGLGLLCQLKQVNSIRQPLPVAIMSSSDLQNDIVDVYKIGAVTFLKKPTTREAWVEHLGFLQKYWND